MRFNGKELAAVALQPSYKFEKEGVLLMKERQDGLFKRGEVYVERWCRLRGNLLFYFKSKDQCSEPCGLLLLERCTVELDTKEDLPFSFILVFENDDRIQYLAALSEAERDAWIQALHIASYECMKCQLQSLREQIISKTGKDPLINHEFDKEVIPGNQSSYLENPSIEMSLACDNLMCDATGQPPNPTIVVNINNPPKTYWTRHSQTETIEKCSNPHFLTTIEFNSSSGITSASRIKLNVYDVRERISGTMTLLGEAVFLVHEICAATNNQARFALISPEGGNVGFVTVKAWVVEPQEINDSPKSQRELILSSDEVPNEGLLQGLRASMKSLNHQMLKKLYTNILTKSYRFHSGLGADLSVHEYMGESRLSFFIPQQLIRLLLREEKERMEELKQLGELRPEWQHARKELIERHLHLINTYTQAIENINEHSDLGFKPSSKKGERSLEFVPINLHIQRMWIQNESTKKGKCFDVTTVGAFTAYPQKYKNGGVHRMLMQQQNTSISGVDNNILGPAKLAKAREIKINTRQAEFIAEDHIETLLVAATSHNPETVQKSAEVLTEKVRHLCNVCDSTFVEEAVAAFDRAKSRTSLSDTPIEFSDENKEGSDCGSILDGMISWSWNGDTDKKSPDEPEPWDLTRLNVEATLMCVAAKVELLTRSVADSVCSNEDYDVRDWVEELKPCIQKLEEAVNHLYNRVNSSLTFVTIQESTTSATQDLTIRYRRDVVFSHAITAVTSAFLTRVHYTPLESPFFTQIQEIGLLCEFEGLMSCYGDEMGMIEDMWIAVTDLQIVKFLLRRAVNSDDVFPQLLGNRKEITVTIPVPNTTFSSLPKKLQSGQLVNIIPLFFNIGINQHATLAEKFNQIFLQETINADSAAILTAYHDRYVSALASFVPKIKQLDRRHSSNGFEATIPDLLQELQFNIRSKKKKNVDILHLAAEITRKLDGLRFISCKSAKDRTSMAVTLEQCLILHKDYDLAPHEFLHALDCMRSDGTRRDNTLKNAGAKKYAFNSLQLMALPTMYRPPPGTYGNVQT